MKNEFHNTNSKEIWSNNLLCAQFLRGYSGVPLLAHVQPEDITDETEKLRPFLGVEFEGDAVKKVRIKGQSGELFPVYVVTLLEHKSSVDYDVTFQLLKYMTGVWTLYRNEQNALHPGASGRKGFRYPLIIPIVYYEGKENWTADMCWKDRVEFSAVFGEYVPDFTYRVINLHRYSTEELLSREEELSLVMLFNRIQKAEDLDFRNWSAEQRKMTQKILKKAPEAVLELLGQIVHHFGIKLNVPEENLRQYIKNVEDRNMGELWANMDKIDIQEIWRQQAENQKKMDAKQKEIDAEQKEMDTRQKKMDAKQKEMDARQKKMDAEQKKIEAARKDLEEQKMLLQAEIARLKNQ